MKKVIAILFMLLLTAQFVQVTLNFSQSSYAVTLDEEQKEKVGKADGKVIKEVISSSFSSTSFTENALHMAVSFVNDRLNKPHLERPTPPPNCSC